MGNPLRVLRLPIGRDCQAAFAGYRDLSQRYIAELNQPRIRLPSLVGLVGTAGVGLVAGRARP